MRNCYRKCTIQNTLQIIVDFDNNSINENGDKGDDFCGPFALQHRAFFGTSIFSGNGLLFMNLFDEHLINFDIAAVTFTPLLTTFKGPYQGPIKPTRLKLGFLNKNLKHFNSSKIHCRISMPIFKTTCIKVTVDPQKIDFVVIEICYCPS